MNGAESLVQTLVNSDVRVCFANPGTSEMHFLAALDTNEGIRCVLCLFEGVASAAADGYARMARKPAATLFHLGPGLANAGANLHNAMRAGSPIVNIVGEHAVPHRHLDAPLTSDIEGLAGTWSSWVKTGRKAAAIAQDAARAVEQAREFGGGISTLILPADTAWNKANEASAARRLPPPFAPSHERIAKISDVLRSGEPVAIVMNHASLASAEALADVDRVAQLTGAEVLADTSFTRIEAGAGVVSIEAVPYSVDQAVERLSHIRHCILIETEEPVAFFAYPGKRGRLLPDDCQVHVLAHRSEDGPQALNRLVDMLGARSIEPRVVTSNSARPLPTGKLSSTGIGASLANRLPEGAIVSDESLTTGGPILEALATARRHSRLQLTGGAIGIGLPLAIGAAIACPEKKTVVLQADGSGMYTVQALWTHARENLDIVSIILSNRSYAILAHELRNVGVANPGSIAQSMISLNDPPIDWTSLATGMGVKAGRATTVDEFDALLATAMERHGPFLIEAVIDE